MGMHGLHYAAHGSQGRAPGGSAWVCFAICDQLPRAGAEAGYRRGQAGDRRARGTRQTAGLAPLAQRMVAGTWGGNTHGLLAAPSARTARAVRSIRYGADVAQPVREHTREASVAAARPSYP